MPDKIVVKVGVVLFLKNDFCHVLENYIVKEKRFSFSFLFSKY